MSSPPGGRTELVAAAVRATRQMGGQAVLFTQAVAERLGLAPIDVECLEILAEAGRLSAGRLAELTGLTSGATTRMLDRLEQANCVRRTADPADRRRVLVEPMPERAGAVRALYASLAQAIQAAMADYPDDQLRIIVDQLERSLQAIGTETARVRQGSPADRAGTSAYTAPIGAVSTGRLVFLSGAPSVTIRGERDLGADLYRARFEGPVPRVRVRDGVVTVHYAHPSWFDWRARLGGMALEASVHWRSDRGEIGLNASLPWTIEFRGGASRVMADLAAVELRSFDLGGGVGKFELVLPLPQGAVPIRVAGGVNEVTIHRPEGSAVRLAVRGGATRVTLDGRRGWGNETVETPGAGSSVDRYEIEVNGGANKVTVDEKSLPIGVR